MRKRRARGWMVLLGLALLGNQAMRAESNGKLPEWVMAAAAEPVGPFPATANAVVLCEDEVLTIAPDGKAEYRMRIAVKILHPPGRADAMPVVSYDKDAPLKSFAVWSIAPDGHRFAMKKYQYVDLGDTDDGMLYEDDRYRAANPPGADRAGSWRGSMCRSCRCMRRN